LTKLSQLVGWSTFWDTVYSNLIIRDDQKFSENELLDFTKRVTCIYYYSANACCAASIIAIDCLSISAVYPCWLCIRIHGGSKSKLLILSEYVNKTQKIGGT